jgi:hypothetical protein
VDIIKLTENKTKSDCLLDVPTYIQSFPRIESHNCRATRVYQYLEGTFSITFRYRLYNEKCTCEKKAFVKENVDRNVFVTKFNLKI